MVDFLNVLTVEDLKPLGTVSELKAMIEEIIYPLRITADSYEELLSIIEILKEKWSDLIPDGYFKNDECKYIFCLTEVDGKKRNSYIGLVDDLYENKEKAQRWYRNILKHIHPDNSSNTKAEEAFRELNKIYKNIMDCFEEEE